MARISPLPAALGAAERWLLQQTDLVVASVGLADRVRRVAPGARVREWRFPSGTVVEHSVEAAGAPPSAGAFGRHARGALQWHVRGLSGTASTWSRAAPLILAAGAFGEVRAGRRGRGWPRGDGDGGGRAGPGRGSHHRGPAAAIVDPGISGDGRRPGVAPIVRREPSPEGVRVPRRRTPDRGHGHPDPPHGADRRARRAGAAQPRRPCRRCRLAAVRRCQERGDRGVGPRVRRGAPGLGPVPPSRSPRLYQEAHRDVPA